MAPFYYVSFLIKELFLGRKRHSLSFGIHWKAELVIFYCRLVVNNQGSLSGKVFLYKMTLQKLQIKSLRYILESKTRQQVVFVNPDAGRYEVGYKRHILFQNRLSLATSRPDALPFQTPSLHHSCRCICLKLPDCSLFSQISD